MRHAKSDWGHPGLDDYDRPLNDRGLDDAPRMGRALAASGVVPDRIVSSPARRARQTAEMVAEACGYAGPIRWDESLYGAPGSVCCEVLGRTPEKTACVLVIAHSPGVNEAAAALLAGPGRRAGSAMIRFPTSGIVCVETTVGRWAEVGPGCGHLRWFLVPRLVKALR